VREGTAEVLAVVDEGAADGVEEVGDALGNRASDELCNASPDPLPAVTLAHPAAVSTAASAATAARALIGPSRLDRRAADLA
jgi:hypothetical protein